MEGRYPAGIYVELFERGPGLSEEQFDEWCERTHVPDMLGTGLVSHPTRYRSIDHGPEEAEYLIIYEAERDDALEDLDARLASQHWPRWRAGGRVVPDLDVRTQVWRRFGRSFTSARSGTAPITGLMVVQSNCSDPAGEPEYRAWYDEVHIPDVLRTGLYHTVYRYTAVSRQPGQGEYLALYETDAPDVAEADREYRDKWRAVWRDQGKVSPYHQRVGRGLLKRI